MLKKVIKYSATWCSPCQTYAPTFKMVSEMEEFKDVTFEEVDIEKLRDMTIISQKLGIKSVPTTIFFDENDEPIYKVMGKIPEKDLIELTRKAKEK